MIVENICCQGSVLGYEFYFRSKVRIITYLRYRRASGKLMVKETEELRKTMDEILSEIIKEWDGYEQVFQDG